METDYELILKRLDSIDNAIALIDEKLTNILSLETFIQDVTSDGQVMRGMMRYGNNRGDNAGCGNEEYGIMDDSRENDYHCSSACCIS